MADTELVLKESLQSSCVQNTEDSRGENPGFESEDLFEKENSDNQPDACQQSPPLEPSACPVSTVFETTCSVPKTSYMSDEEASDTLSSEDDWQPSPKKRKVSSGSSSTDEERRGRSRSRKKPKKRKRRDHVYSCHERRRKSTAKEVPSCSGAHGDSAIQPEPPEPDVHQSADTASPCTADAKNLNTQSAVHRKKSTRHKSQKTNAKRHRERKHCVIEGCDALVVNLHRHMEQVHVDIPRFEAKKMLRDNKKEPKRRFPVYSCAIENCHWRGTRLERHLVSKTHGMEKEYARKMTKTMKVSSLPEEPVRGKNMHTAQSLTQSFSQWFQSIEGGNYIPDFLDPHKQAQKKSQNQKCNHMVQTVLEYCLDRGEFHASALDLLQTIGRPSECGGISVVEKLHEDRSWGTVKNYLNTFSHFVDFLESNYPPLLHKSTVASIRINLKGSIQTVIKMALDELQRRKISDRERVIDFENILQYQRTNFAQTLTKTLSVDDTESEKDNAYKIHRVARHILLQIALPNGKRAGVFADLKCFDVKEALKEADGFVILVGEGKTFRVSGAAGIFCSNSEYELLANYIAKWRMLLKPQTDQVFCGPSGERADVGEIGDYLKSAWVEFGAMVCKDVGDITFTLIRKSIVSKSRSEGVSKEVKEQMATHMDHDVATADRHYDVSTGAKMTAKFRHIFDQFHDPLDSDNTSDNADILPSDRLVSSCPTSTSYQFKDVKCVQRKSQNASFFEKNECSQGTRGSTFGKPNVFTDEDKLRLYRCCIDIIEGRRNKSGTGVTKSEILHQVKSASPNFSDLLHKYSINQICNRIRCEIRKQCPVLSQKKRAA